MTSHNTNQMRRQFQLGAVFVACALAHGAAAAIVVTNDAADWASQTGPFTTLGFTELAQGEFLTDQYAELGVMFTGTAVGWFSETAFPTDNHGIYGWTSKVVEAQFAAPITELAVEFASGNFWVLLYLGDDFVDKTPVMSQFFDGPFVGIVSEMPFDRVEMLAPGVGVTLIDNIHFGAPIPAPGAVALIALVGFAGQRRRHE